MGLHIKEDRSVKYYSQDHGWSDHETSDTKLRLVSVSRAQHQSYVDNQMSRPNPRGGWTEVTGEEEYRLQGYERGYVFQIKPRRGAQGTFAEIHPMRYVDDEMVAELLQGLKLHDADLREVDPALITTVFCLTGADMQVFSQRVQQFGGTITEAQADVHGMYNAAQRMYAIAHEMNELCRTSRAVIEQVAQGVNTEAPSISDRCRTAQSLRDQATELLKDIRDEYVALERSGEQAEALAYGQKYVENSEKWMTHIDRLHQEHKSYEVQAVQRIKDSITLPAPDAGSASRRYLMMPLVNYYTQQGYDARITEEGMVLRLGEFVVELTDRPRIISPETQQQADVSFGRGEVQRGQREL